MFQEARYAGSAPARWGLHPSYMHTFAITVNYFVIIEQPMSVSVPAMVKNAILGEPMMASLRWFPKENVTIRLNPDADTEFDVILN